jgi:hypothetical protein
MLKKYVRTIIESSICSKHSNESDKSRTSKINRLYLFGRTQQASGAFKCQNSGADSDEIRRWTEPFLSWSTTKITKQKARGISITRNSGVSLGLNPIDNHVPEILGQKFEKWLFRVSCAFRRLLFRLSANECTISFGLEALISSTSDLLEFRSSMTSAGCLHWAA